MKKNNFLKAVMIFFTLIAMAGCAELLVLKEKACFNNAEKENTIGSYEGYLKEYPSGTYKREAMDRIEDITWEEIRRKNLTPTKPKVDPSAKETCYTISSRFSPGIEDRICTKETSDGGKLCTSSNECQGSCLGSDFLNPNGESGREGRRIGKCSHKTLIGLGCNVFIEDGYETTICGD